MVDRVSKNKKRENKPSRPSEGASSRIPTRRRRRQLQGAAFASVAVGVGMVLMGAAAPPQSSGAGAAGSTPVSQVPGMPSPGGTSGGGPMHGTAPTHTVAPLTVKVLPGGVHQYEFLIGGKLNVMTTAPASFHPLTATNAELQKYGFPLRPTAPGQLRMWQKAMAHWKSSPRPTVTVTDIYNRMLFSHSVAHTPSQRIVNGTTESSNWSGYYTDSSYNRWDAAQGSFIQPTDYSSSPNKYESGWVGLGGVNSGALIQDGTQMNAGQYGAWYEYLGNGGAGVPEINFNSITVNPGDQIYTFVSYDPNNGQAYFYVEDETNGTSQSATVDLGSDYYDGTTAEWINERPEIGSSLSQLADYGTQTWTGAQAYNAYTGNWDNVGDVTNNAIDMYSSGGQLLSAAGSLASSTSWTDTWYASGN